MANSRHGHCKRNNQFYFCTHSTANARTAGDVSYTDQYGRTVYTAGNTVDERSGTPLTRFNFRAESANPPRGASTIGLRAAKRSQ